MLRVYAESAGGKGGRQASTPSKPTSVQGKYYAAGGRSGLGQKAPGGRGRIASFIAPRRGRAG